MSQEVQVGSILMLGWPPFPGLDGEGWESEPYLGPWNVLKGVYDFALDRKTRAAGWNFFFVASEVKVMFLGAIRARKIQHALHRILGRVSPQHFNSLEVTGIVAKRFLDVPYAVVSAHSRHIQRGCYLESAELRQSSERDAAIARG